MIPRDLLQQYGVDLADPTYDSRSWLWLRDLIIGLLDIPESRLTRALTQ